MKQGEKNRQRAIDVKNCIERIFKSDDGKYLMEFLEEFAGFESFLKPDMLQGYEGMRRLVILFKKATKLNGEDFINWCKREEIFYL